MIEVGHGFDPALAYPTPVEAAPALPAPERPSGFRAVSRAFRHRAPRRSGLLGASLRAVPPRTCRSPRALVARPIRAK